MPCHMLHITAIKVQSIHHTMHIQRKCNYLYAAEVQPSFVTFKTAVSLPNQGIYQLFCRCSKHVLNESQHYREVLTELRKENRTFQHLIS